ncbi:MAG: hypothetical protein R2861_02755 [Desulfobacterales bacterium]
MPYSDKTLMCGICPHNCLLDKGDRGICRSRVNIDGILYTLAYGNACSVNIDPIEKPLFHFKPASRAFSIAAAGCNFRCLNCQNWQISQVTPEATRFFMSFFRTRWSQPLLIRMPLPLPIPILRRLPGLNT